MAIDLDAWRRTAFDSSPPAWAYDADLVREIIGPAERKVDEVSQLRAEIAELRAQNSGLTKRLVFLERLTKPDGVLVKSICEGIAKALGRARSAVEDRIAAVEQRVPLPSAADMAAIARRGPAMHYRGVWSDRENYQPGDMTTFNNAGWISEIESKGLKPGEGAGWKLAIKSDWSIVHKAVRDAVERQLKSTSR